MKTRWIMSALLLVGLLVSAVQPLLSQEAAPEVKAHTPREDAPAFGVRGPYAVGVRDFVIEAEQEGGRTIPATVWYPALNPEGLPEEVTYMLDFDNPGFPDFAVAGRALRNANPDRSGGPYPLVIYSHGLTLFRQASSFLAEHLASQGFVVISGDHEDNWSALFSGESERDTFVTRPQDITTILDFGEFIGVPDGDMAGMIDMEHIGVIGHSFGAETALLAGGARLNTEQFLSEWCATDPADMLADCPSIATLVEQMAEMAGLEDVPDAVWPDWSDPRVDAIVAYAPGPQHFGPEGLATVQVPVLLFESELDWYSGAASAHYEPSDLLPKDLTTHIVFRGGDHTLYMNDCRAMPALVDMGLGWFCYDPVWDMNRAHDIINHFTAAFLAAELKGNADAIAALAPEAASFPGITYQSKESDPAAEIAEPALPVTKRSALAAVNDIILYYEIVGEGEPLLLLNGGTGCTESWAWGNQYEALGQHYTVIAPDSRAQGRSTDSDEPLSYQLMADDMVALLDHLGIDSAHVVGWSDGGNTGLDMAIRYPDRVRSLVATGAQFRADGMIPDELEWVEDLTVDSFPPDWMDQCYRSVASEPDHLPIVIEKLRDMWLAEEYVPFDGLADIVAPVLVLEGTVPDWLLSEHVEDLAAAIPNAELTWIEDSGHFAPSEKAEEWNAAVLAFLDTVEADRLAAKMTEIEALVENTMEENSIPGFALGVVKDGEVVYSKGFGVAEDGTDRMMTPETLIPAASLSKQFTAAAIMQLVEQGKIDLDAPVADFVPYFEMADPRHTEMTIRQLLSHTSGMPQIPQREYGYDSEDPGTGALEALVRDLVESSLDEDPGATWSYSNLGFNLLGDIVANVSGQPFEEYIEQHILDPLGMESSTYLFDEIDFDSVASGHFLDEAGKLSKTEEFPYTRAYAPAAGLVTNLNDLNRWALALSNHGEADGVRITEKSSCDEMWTPVIELGWGGLLQDYGLGWIIAEENGHHLAWHLGSNPGYLANVIVAADDGIGVVTLDNFLPPTEDPPWHASDVGNAAMLILLGVEPGE